MVYDSLHENITLLAWGEAESILNTSNGRDMAKEKFKNDLPLHMAVERRAPDYLIISILKANRDAASVPGKYGALPLHHAAHQNLSANVVVQLIKAYPEALDIADANQITPRDHNQRNSLSREALLRPTACWIEDVEKEQYLERVTNKRKELRRKIAQIKEATETSSKRSEVASNLISLLGPKIVQLESSIAIDEKHRTQLADIKNVMQTHIKSIQDRVTFIESQMDDDGGPQVHMMNSLLKREYLERVKSSYDKVMMSHHQIKSDLKILKESLKDKVQDENSPWPKMA